jgi:hypothetical protein
LDSWLHPARNHWCNERQRTGKKTVVLNRAGMFGSGIRSILIFYSEKQWQAWTSRVNFDLCLSAQGWYVKFFLKINLVFLFRKTGASLNFKNDFWSVHISPWLEQDQF